MARVSATLNISTLAVAVDGAYGLQIAAIDHQHLELIGSATVSYTDSDTPTLVDVYVHEAHRCTGIGTQLIRAAKRWADHQGKELYLHVMPDNAAARRLYEAEGFEYTGEVKEEGSLWMIRCCCDGRLVGKEAAAL